MNANLIDLATIFSQLSLVAVGGGNTILPEMQRQVVSVHHWMTAAEFAALFALAQASPGPNMMVSTLIGWRVAGVAGAFVATAGLIGPSCLLTFVTASFWHRFSARRWRRQVQAGITPVTVGLVMAAAVLLSEATGTTAGAWVVTAATTVLLLTTRLHPLIPLGIAAGLGVAGLV